MNKYNVDQSHFSEFQDAVQPPPEFFSKSKKSSNGLLRPGILFAGILGFIILGMLVVFLYLGQISQPAMIDIQPTPTPIPTANNTELEKRFLQLESLLRQADPDEEPLNLPVVEMDISL